MTLVVVFTGQVWIFSDNAAGVTRHYNVYLDGVLQDSIDFSDNTAISNNEYLHNSATILNNVPAGTHTIRTELVTSYGGPNEDDAVFGEITITVIPVLDSGA